jgi:putative serine protease PepD
VTFADGTVSAATLLDADPANDIAILMPATLPGVVVPAVFGSSGRLAVGDAVVAIGNQLGLTGSTTAGRGVRPERAANGTDGTTSPG